ncbi:intercellular adhesion molecule 3-like [Scomber scombrus]|uniref:intercellular adhesion molecule 3-like n=1 Tax=Scomber scombrus TaxID=13677 RepID=UPI002DD9A728|nr:intercellular adhesion molecule 3-like [Scomber scombrus]
MFASGWPITLLLFCLFDSATSSPVSMYTPAPPLRSHISPPSPIPTIIPSLQSPSRSTPPSTPSFDSNSAETTETTENDHCPLTISPSPLVVRFGDPAKANCSTTNALIVHYIAWESPEGEPLYDQPNVWSVNSMTKWDVTPLCIGMLEINMCHRNLSVIVYKPPDSVSITFANHTGPMFEGRQYTLQCTVLEVAPIGNLTVTFYRGPTKLQRRQSNSTTKEPVNETFTLDINPSKEDDGGLYWCEAELDLGTEGPQPPPVVTSQNITAVVLFGPHLVCPEKMQVIEGGTLSCEVRGNPKPKLVTWFKDGQVVSLPTHSSRKHAGKYTVSVDGQKNLTLEVEVLPGSGTANCCNSHFLLAVLLIQIFICCKP